MFSPPPLLPYHLHPLTIYVLLCPGVHPVVEGTHCSSPEKLLISVFISVSGPGGVRPRVFSNYWAENKSVRIQEVILPHLSYPPQLWNRTKWQEEPISTGRQRGHDSHESCKTTSSKAGSESLSWLPLGSESNGNSPEPHHSMCGPWTSSTGVIWELARNAASQTSAPMF